QLANGGNGADAHHARIDSRDCAAEEAAERLDAQLPRLLLAGDHERGRTIVDPARVPRGDGAAGAERGLERGQPVGSRVRPGVLVAGGAVHREELVVETAGLGGRGPALLRTKSES